MKKLPQFCPDGKGVYSMKEFLSSYVRRKPDGSAVEEVHEMARDYFGADFPNPARVGCLPRESFRKLIDENGLPAEKLQNHLFGCSECFNEYQSELRRAKRAEVSKKNIFPFQLKPLLAGAFIAALIALGGLFRFILHLPKTEIYSIF